jgi:hypothetical protein
MNQIHPASPANNVASQSPTGGLQDLLMTGISRFIASTARRLTAA